jgi:hypothetical protein
MSIREEWMKLVVDEELFELEPLAGDKNARTILLSREMWDLLSSEMEEGESANRRSKLLATLQNWPAPGFEDTELGVLLEPEVAHGEAEVYAGVQA